MYLRNPTLSYVFEFEDFPTSPKNGQGVVYVSFNLVNPTVTCNVDSMRQCCIDTEERRKLREVGVAMKAKRDHDRENLIVEFY